MQQRKFNLEVAEEILFDFIFQAAVESDSFKIQKQRIIHILISLENKRILIAGDRARKFVPIMTMKNLEDMLNLLYQFGKIKSYKSKLSGNVFEVCLQVHQLAESKIIQLPIKKAA